MSLTKCPSCKRILSECLCWETEFDFKSSVVLAFSISAVGRVLKVQHASN